MAKKKFKPWHKLTEEEICEIKIEKCMNCPYRSTLSLRCLGVENSTGARKHPTEHDILMAKARFIACDYIGITGHPRGCRPEECEHHKDKMKRRKARSYTGEMIFEEDF